MALLICSIFFGCLSHREMLEILSEYKHFCLGGQYGKHYLKFGYRLNLYRSIRRLRRDRALVYCYLSVVRSSSRGSNRYSFGSRFYIWLLGQPTRLWFIIGRDGLIPLPMTSVVCCCSLSRAAKSSVKLPSFRSRYQDRKNRASPDNLRVSLVWRPVHRLDKRAVFPHNPHFFSSSRPLKYFPWLFDLVRSSQAKFNSYSRSILFHIVSTCYFYCSTRGSVTVH